MRRAGGIGLALVLVVVFVGLIGYRVTQHVVHGPNQQYYQRTRTDRQGKIDRQLYTQSQLTALTAITHGSQYHGNTSLDLVATRHVYQLNGESLPNMVGKDGVLQLYSQSKFMTPRMVRAAADYWNRLAGVRIVEIVDQQYQSDEVIHDADGHQGVLGGQTYDGRGIQFYPANWHIERLSAKDQNNWKEAALIHEMGHALGIPHLGGGPLGANAANAGVTTTEFMGPWSVGKVNSPPQNAAGVQSTAIDAAALALAGLSWQHPRKLASWVLTSPLRSVRYDNGVVTVTVP